MVGLLEGLLTMLCLSCSRGAWTVLASELKMQYLMTKLEALVDVCGDELGWVDIVEGLYECNVL